jgi:SLT domain-containing protein
MKTRLLHTLFAAAVLALALLTGFTVPASAQQQTVYVKLPSGEVVPVTVDVPPGGSLNDIQLPGAQVPAPTTTTPPSTTPTSPATPTTPTTAEPTPKTDTNPSTTPAPNPRSTGGSAQGRSGSGERIQLGDGDGGALTGNAKARRKNETSTGGADGPLRNADGSPTVSNPGFVDALPGPSSVGGVPNFIIRKFRVPPFLLPIYQAAGIEYGIRWEVLAAINEIETDYGRNLNVSTAGALGWMQFMPATWKTYGTDANKDGKKDPYNPVDAIFAAARYLKAAGYSDDVRRSIYAYNHADWYVDSVLLRARLIAGVPADLIGSLTGLTEGRFPVYARARYADDLAEKGALKHVGVGQNAANVIESDANRRGIEIYARQGSPVVAVNDGVIKQIGQSKRLGRFVILQDVYGNRYTYGHLGKVSRYYPVPKTDSDQQSRDARALKANEPDQPADPKPTLPASAGRQTPGADHPPAKVKKTAAKKAPTSGDRASAASVPVKRRLFAHPDMPGARASGGLEQLLDSKAALGSSYANYFSRPYGLDSSKVRLRALKKGSHVIGGTILARVGAPDVKASRVQFEIRPAGKDAPRIDPKPILDGWKLLEATAIYRASGRNVLHGGRDGAMSIGQILLLPKPLLEKRVLADERIEIYPGGRDDIRSGQVDRKVLATLAYLAESGLKPTVSCLKNGHSFLTTSGNVSEHSSGNAVDISALNGIPITGHQEAGGVTDQAVRRLMLLQGTMRPHQIISLLDYGQNTLAMADHNDHIHVGFQPLFGANTKQAKQAMAVLKPGQWTDLLQRLGEIDNPVVPTKPSKYAIPVGKHTASNAHDGE